MVIRAPFERDAALRRGGSAGEGQLHTSHCQWEFPCRSLCSGYRPLRCSKTGCNSCGRKKNRTITFILGNRDTVNEFQSKVLLGAEVYCAQHGWDLHFISFRCDLNAPLGSLRLPEALMRSNRPSGVILTGTHSVSILAALSEKKIPFSLVGNNILGEWRPEQYDCVFTDDVRGSTEITRYLIAQGHRNIWYIGNQRLPWFARCAAGYRQAMKEADLEPRFSEISSEDRELGYLAVKALPPVERGPLRFLRARIRPLLACTRRCRNLAYEFPMTSVLQASMTLLAKCCIPGLQRCANSLGSPEATSRSLSCAGFMNQACPRSNRDADRIDSPGKRAASFIWPCGADFRSPSRKRPVKPGIRTFLQTLRRPGRVFLCVMVVVWPG